jgi:lysophospholipase L1-like esterase
MNGMQKVLVVDNGERALDFALSAELAELGYASVTTRLEAADDVLALIPTPAAVVLQVPREATWSERKRFLELAERLRLDLKSRNIPVILVNGAGASGAHASLLQSELGTRILSEPEL